MNKNLINLTVSFSHFSTAAMKAFSVAVLLTIYTQGIKYTLRILTN